jgi:hypothetical protein
MSQPYRPRFARTGQTLDLTHPTQPWTDEDGISGGGEESAAGVPSVWVDHYRPVRRVTLRVLESEWGNLVTFWRATQGIAFTHRPDQDVGATEHTVYWETPSLTNDPRATLTYTRDEGDPSVLLVPVALRRTTSTAFTDLFYEES